MSRPHIDIIAELQAMDAEYEAVVEERDGLMELVRSLEERVKVLELADARLRRLDTIELLVAEAQGHGRRMAGLVGSVP